MNTEKYILKSRNRSLKKHRSIWRRKGAEYVNMFPVTLAWIEDDRLKRLLECDAYGLYKKKEVKIPFKYKRQYKHLKRERELQIYAKYYHFSLSAWRGNYPLVFGFTELSESDKLDIKMLLEKG